MRVESILPVAQQRMVTIRTTGLLVEAAAFLLDTNKALLIVCDGDGVMAGVITKTDIVRQVARHGGLVDNIPLSSVMTEVVISCRGEDALHDVLALMKTNGLVHIPIVDQSSRPRGVVNARDALQALLREVKDEELVLRAYVMGVGYR
jgi:CBS domain-containing protein